jgi:hypothetical protein
MLDRVVGKHHALALLTPEKSAGTPGTGGWVGPRGGLDLCEGKISCCPPGFEDQIVRPIAS